MRYKKPKITTKKLHISFFLTQSNLTDSMGFLFGNVAQAQSSACDGVSNCDNCNNGTCSLGTQDNGAAISNATWEAQAVDSGTEGTGNETSTSGGDSTTSSNNDAGTSCDSSDCACSSDGSQCSCSDCSCSS